MGSAVISQFLLPVSGYHFRFLRHIAAHIPSPGRFIKGIVGLLLFTSSLPFRRHHCCIFFALPSYFTAPLSPLL
jgi:hypothetical protein